MSKRHRLHYKNLYALRFFAFLLVFGYNAFLTTTYMGRISGMIRSTLEHLAMLGLEFFFTLSAFLVTTLALREYKHYGSFNLNHFFIRRMLRVLPLYLLVLIVVYAGTPVLVDNFQLNQSLKDLPPISYFLSFATNFFIIAKQATFIPFLMVLWTLAVLVQFYLVWGVVLKFFKAHIRWIAWAMVVTGFGFRIWAHFNEPSSVINTLYYLSDFGIGALVALELRQKGAWSRKVAELSQKQVLSGYILLGVLPVALFFLVDGTILETLEALAFPLFFAFVILENTASSAGFFKLRKKKLITDLGKLSYGLMMWHCIMLALVFAVIDLMNVKLNPFMVVTVVPATGLVTTIIAAYVSWNYLEKPLLRFRRPFKRA